MVTIGSSDEHIDSRDVIKQLDELQDDIDSQREEIANLEEEIDSLRDEVEVIQDQVLEGDTSEDDGEERIAELNKKIEELEQEIEDCEDEINSLEEEAKPLRELDDEGRSATGGGEWDAGVMLVAEGRPFRAYLQDRAFDQGLDLGAWPLNCINWEQAEEEASSDHAIVEWEGETFYVV